MNKLIAFFLFFFTTSTIFAQALPERAPGQVLVQLAEHVAPNFFLQSIPQQRSISSLSLGRTLHQGANMHLLTFDETQWPGDEVLEMIRRSPLVVNAQFNHRLDYRAVSPNDPKFDDQWSLRKIQAPDAWEVTTGGLSATSDTIVIAVMDGGCELDHEDLRDNIWRNHAEIPDDGIDNDANGYIDDYYGLRIAAKNDEHPAHQHGTRVAGIISAKGNNDTGITGINWDAKLMVLSQVSFEDQVVEAMFYAYEQRKKYNNSNGAEGSFVVACNYSLGVDNGDCVNVFTLWNPTLDSLGKEGILVVGSTANKNVDVDQVGDVPTTCTSDFMIGVTSTNQMDDKVLNAGYGKVSVDLAAPSDGIPTTSPGNTYFDLFGGNSAAAPHVAGAIGLMYSYPCEGLANDALRQPESTARLMKEFLLAGVDVVESMVGLTSSNGRLNVNNSLKLLEGHYGQERGPLNFVNIQPNPVDDLLRISVSLPDFDDYDLTIYDMWGRKVDNAEIPGRCTSPQIEIPVGFLAPGSYFIVLENPENFATGRFIVH